MAERRGHEHPERDKGDMTVQEAGHLGGQKVKELIEKGEQAEGQGK